MDVADIVAHFQGYTSCPIKIRDIREHLVAAGIQDEIRFIGTDGDTGVVRGHIQRYRRRDKVYGDPVFCTDIHYVRNQEPEWQRLVCCKELLHILDPEDLQTSTVADIQTLMDRMALPDGLPSSLNMTPQEAHDRLIEVWATAALFPWPIRQRLVEIRKRTTTAEICAFLELPLRSVNLVMSSFWPDIIAAMIGPSRFNELNNR